MLHKAVSSIILDVTAIKPDLGLIIRVFYHLQEHFVTITKFIILSFGVSIIHSCFKRATKFWVKRS